MRAEGEHNLIGDALKVLRPGEKSRFGPSYEDLLKFGTGRHDIAGR